MERNVHFSGAKIERRANFSNFWARGYQRNRAIFAWIFRKEWCHACLARDLWLFGVWVHHSCEKRNSILWFNDNFVGTELDPELSFAKVAEGCGLKGIQVKTQNELTEALKKSCEEQKKGITTFIEVILNQELGEPFRRDAMKKPVKVAGINKKDMRPQQS